MKENHAQNGVGKEAVENKWELSSSSQSLDSSSKSKLPKIPLIGRFMLVFQPHLSHISTPTSSFSFLTSCLRWTTSKYVFLILSGPTSNLSSPASASKEENDGFRLSKCASKDVWFELPKLFFQNLQFFFFPYNKT